MSDYLRLLLVLAVAVNPAAAWLAWEPTAGALAKRARRLAAAAWLAVAVGIITAAILVASALLDWLAVAPETFRIAAAIVMVTAGVLALWRARAGVSDRHDEDPDWQAGIAPLGLPILAGPAALVAAMSYGLDAGQGKAWAALVPWVALAAALSLAPPGRWSALADGLARLCGALLVVVSAGLFVEGVRDI